MYEWIRYEVNEGVATITLDRPDKLNAYTPEMGDEAVSAFECARDDKDVRVVILTGEGRAFCAGVDLEFLEAHMAGESRGSGPKRSMAARTWRPCPRTRHPVPRRAPTSCWRMRPWWAET